MITVQAQDTLVMWECCTDYHGEPFDSCGFMTTNKKAALKDLKRYRVRRPDTYLVKVVFTRCAPEEEQVEPKLH